MSQPTIAIVGASSDREKYGNKAIRAYLSQGYEVYPVNPKGGTIEGLTAYKSVAEIPIAPVERISLYVPPAVGITLLEEIAAKGCDELWLNPGSESEELVQKALDMGLNPIVACSIVDVGVSPHTLDG